MIDKQQDFLTLTGAARRARSEGYDITYHGLRNLVAAGYISHVPNGSRIYVFYPNVIHFLQKGLTAEQSLDYQLVLRGEIEHYLSLGCDHGRMED